MNKTTQIFLGVLTFLPFLIILSSIGWGMYTIIETVLSPEAVNPLMYLSYLGYVIPFLFFYTLFYLALGIFYLAHIIRNPFLDTEKKGLWFVVLIVLNGLSMPFYWYLHI